VVELEVFLRVVYRQECKRVLSHLCLVLRESDINHELGKLVYVQTVTLLIFEDLDEVLERRLVEDELASDSLDDTLDRFLCVLDIHQAVGTFAEFEPLYIDDLSDPCENELS